MEACIDTRNNLWIDYSLINPVKWSSNFIELNTYGLVYNKNKPDTQKNKNGISFSDLPYLTNMNNQLQIYVSEYSINSAAKTFINTFSKTIEFKADANILDSFLHGFKNVFPDPTGDVLLAPKGLPQIQITNKGLSVKYPHYITVWAWSRKSKPAFHGIIELNLEIDLAVEKGPTIYANIKDLSAKVVRIDVNDVNSNPNTAIEGTFKILKDTVIGLFNELAKNMKYKFPTVMGLNFTDLKLEFKNNHIVINYNLS